MSLKKLEVTVGESNYSIAMMPAEQSSECLEKLMLLFGASIFSVGSAVFNQELGDGDEEERLRLQLLAMQGAFSSITDKVKPSDLKSLKNDLLLTGFVYKQQEVGYVAVGSLNEFDDAFQIHVMMLKVIQFNYGDYIKKLLSSLPELKSKADSLKMQSQQMQKPDANS